MGSPLFEKFLNFFENACIIRIVNNAIIPPPPTPTTPELLESQSEADTENTLALFSGKAPTSETRVSLRDKFKLTLTEISHVFGLPFSKVKRQLESAQAYPDGKVFRYDIADVTTLRDFRRDMLKDEYGNNVSQLAIDLLPDDIDPRVAQLSLDQQRKHFQALDLHQAYMLKKQKIQVADRTLVEASEMQQVLASAFKVIVKYLDNLPDTLEREGIINNSDVLNVMEQVDYLRTQLAHDLSVLGDIEKGIE